MRGLMGLCRTEVARHIDAGDDMACSMYVPLQNDHKIAVFTVDAGTGTLTPKSEMPVPGGPSPLAISLDRTVL